MVTVSFGCKNAKSALIPWDEERSARGATQLAESGYPASSLLVRDNGRFRLTWGNIAPLAKTPPSWMLINGMVRSVIVVSQYIRTIDQIATFCIDQEFMAQRNLSCYDRLCLHDYALL